MNHKSHNSVVQLNRINFMNEKKKTGISDTSNTPSFKRAMINNYRSRQESRMKSPSDKKEIGSLATKKLLISPQPELK